jgi:glycosyltransferase involved in cell wall biosynthesis
VTGEISPLRDLSVLVTCYNKLDSVDGFMTQVLKLNKLGCQIVIIDDGSDDGSTEKISRNVSELRNCKFVRQENQGSAAARNRGILESDRKFIQFLDFDDFLNIELLQELFNTHQFSEDSLTFFEYTQLTKPEPFKYSLEKVPKILSKIEIEKELLERMGYWRIIYPRKIVTENNLRFIPTFQDLGGKRFILDDLFWLIHITAIGINCLKYNKEAVIYGYVKGENPLHDDGIDFSNQASLFPLATSTFISKLSDCDHPHNKDLLETILMRTLMFHARYIRATNLAFYVKNVMGRSNNLEIRKSSISNEFFKIRLCSIAFFHSLKYTLRKLALKDKRTTKIWQFFKTGKNSLSP